MKSAAPFLVLFLLLAACHSGQKPVGGSTKDQPAGGDENGSISLPAPSESPEVEQEFQKGVNFVCWYPGCFLEEEVDASLDFLQDVGVTWLAIVPTWYQETLTSNIITAHPDRSPTEADLRLIIEEAKARGMHILLKPHVDILAGGWRGDIVPANSLVWQRSYRAFLHYFARLAEELEVETLSIGTELKNQSPNTAFWLDLTERIRRIYGGQLTYSANWDEYDSIEFWGPLDHIGIDFYFPLTDDPDATQAEMIEALRRIGEDLAGYASSQVKAIVLTEIGYRSIDGANTRPYDFTWVRPLDLGEQADAYAAVLTAFAEADWLDGIFWWRADPRLLGGPDDDGYLIYGKPAADILRRAWR